MWGGNVQENNSQDPFVEEQEGLAAQDALLVDLDDVGVAGVVPDAVRRFGAGRRRRRRRRRRRNLGASRRHLVAQPRQVVRVQRQLLQELGHRVVDHGPHLEPKVPVTSRSRQQVRTSRDHHHKELIHGRVVSRDKRTRTLTQAV